MATTIGQGRNHWKTTNNGTTYNLTRSNHLSTTSPITVPMQGTRKEVILEPSRAALVVVDMQNFFLHPTLRPSATAGRDIAPRILDMITAFHKRSIPVIWLNWGLVDEDLEDMPPALTDVFSDKGNPETSFGSEMGTLTDDGSDDIKMGRKLFRQSWNTRPWGPLWPVFKQGLDKGTDKLFHKNRLSGLCSPNKLLEFYLKQHNITSLFFSGVDSDACVWHTAIDAYAKGYDIIYVEDCAATPRPQFAADTVRCHADLMGFVAESGDIVGALG